MLHRWPGPAGKAKHTKKKKKEMLFNMAVTDSKILKKAGPFGTKVPLRNEMLLHMILYL